MVHRSSSFSGAGGNVQGRFSQSTGHNSVSSTPEVTLYQLLSSPQTSGVLAAHESPGRYAAVEQANSMLQASSQQAQLLLLQQQSQLQQSATGQQEQQVLELQRMQDLQRLQNQLQQLLEQQASAQQQMPGQKQVQVQKADPDKLSVHDTLMPQLQMLQQQTSTQVTGGAQYAISSGPFAVQSFLGSTLASAPQSCSISITPCGGSAWAELPAACPLAAQQQQGTAQQQPQAQFVAHQDASGSGSNDDGTEVAALDGLINQCLSRLLQLRTQITARRAAAAPLGSSCSTPTATSAMHAGQGLVLTAASRTSDSLLMQSVQLSQPQLFLQQQHQSGVQSPASVASIDTSMAGQQQVFNGGAVWAQQPQQHRIAAAGSPAVLVGTSGLSMPGHAGSACLHITSGCLVSGTGLTQASTILLQQQQSDMLTQQQSGMLTQQQSSMLSQQQAQQQQAMMQSGGLQMGGLMHSDDPASRYVGYFGGPASGAPQHALLSPGTPQLLVQVHGQQVLLHSPGMGQMQQGMGQMQQGIGQMQQGGAAAVGSTQLSQQQLQELQQLLAQQQMQGMQLN
jgi:hypothetical protein